MNPTTDQTIDPSTFKEGDRVTFTFTDRHFDTTLVEEKVGGTTSLRAATSPDGGYRPVVIAWPEGGEPEVAYGIHDLRLIEAAVPEPSEVVRLREQVAELEREVAAAKERHRVDIATIGAALIEEADERDWCSEYDEVVDEINSRLTVNLPAREREYRVSYDVTLTVHHVVRATSEQDAQDKAGDLLDDDHAIEAIRQYADPDYNLVEVEVEEV